MGKFLRIVNGVPRHVDEASSIPIYDQNIAVVSGTPANGNEIQGPVTAGAAITLPLGETFEGQELEVHLNGQIMEPVFDVNYVGGGPTYSQISFTFQLVVGDVIGLRKVRSL